MSTASTATVDPGQFPDDAEAINAALRDPAITTVILGPGEFKLHSPIFIPSGKTLQGAGRDLTWLRADPDFTRAPRERDGLVNSEDFATGIRLADFSVDAAKLSPNGFRMVGVFMRSATHFDIERVDVYNSTAYAHMSAGGGNGRYSDIWTYNSQVHYEQMGADGITLTNVHARDGDGDIPTEAYFHPLAGAKNITYIDATGYGKGFGGFYLVSIGTEPLENIRIIDSHVELETGAAALMVQGSLPTLNLDVSDSSFISHFGTAARFGGVTGTVTNSSFQGRQVGIHFHDTPDGSSPAMLFTNTSVLALTDPKDGAAAFATYVDGGDITWDGGTIEARGDVAYTKNDWGVLNITPATEIIRGPFDTKPSYVENAAAVVVAGNFQLPDSVEWDLEGGTLLVRHVVVGTSEDLFSILHSGTGPGEIGVSGNEITFEGVPLGTFAGGENGNDLIVTFGPEATIEAAQALVKAISFSNGSDNPVVRSRFVEVILMDGAGNTADALAAILMTAVNDVPILTAPGGVEGREDTDLIFSAANSNAIVVADVDDQTATVRLSVAEGWLTLAQTTGLDVAGDGTGTIELAGSMSDINSALDGLVYRANFNFEGADTLQVTVNDGAASITEIVAIDVADFGSVDGTDASDNLIGTAHGDVFDLRHGGDDASDGLGGNDTFYFGAAFTAGDTVDGGVGNDALILQGDYSAGITFGSGTTSNISNLESISLAPGNITTFGDTAGNLYDYDLTTIDSNVAAGGFLKVNGFLLQAGEDFTFDGSDETDGSFILFAGKGVETLIGGAKNDFFLFGQDGRFAAGDTVVGGAGYDSFYLRGNYTIDFNAPGLANSFSEIESVTLASAMDSQFFSGGGSEFDYSITWNDAMLASGQTITINGSRLLASETLVFDGSSELGGHFRIFAGAGNDVLRGGTGNDLIFGGHGADNMYGGGGNDVFRYASAADSASESHDIIADFSSGDLIDLSAVDANGIVEEDQAFIFVGADAFTSRAGELRAYESTTPGTWFAEGDTDGDGVADLTIQIDLVGGASLTAADFVF